MKDDVNFPSHYTSGEVESIDAIWSTGHGVGFCVGNALKYLHRAGKKGSSSLEQDVAKAHWYLDFLLSKLKEGHPDPRTRREASKPEREPFKFLVELERKAYGKILEDLRASIDLVELKVVDGGTAIVAVRDDDLDYKTLATMVRRHFTVVSVR